MAGASEVEDRLDGKVQPEENHGSRKNLARKWFKEWVPQDTVWNNGKCLLFKWVTEETLNALKTKQAEGEQTEAEEEHEVVYLCSSDGCGKVFSDSSSLRKHAHVHGEKQYICHYEGCGKRFMDSSKLKRHNLIHTGEKHFMCPFEGCGKAFSLPFNLRTHVRTHTGENYHRCPFEDCPKRYAHEYKLKKHMRVHHEKRTPVSTKPEAVHVEREQIPSRLASTPVMSPSPATLDRPFVCPYEGCGKQYKHVYKLNLHLKGVHAAEEEQQQEERAARGSEGEEDVDNSSDRDRDRDPTFGERGKGSDKGKVKVTAKAPPTKRKRPPTKPPPPDKRQSTLSLSKKKKPTSRPPAAEAADSEETVDEEAEDGQQRVPAVLRTQILEDDREGRDDSYETEDDIEY